MSATGSSNITSTTDLGTQILSIASAVDGKRLRVERIARGKHSRWVELNAHTLEVIGTEPSPDADWLPTASVETGLVTSTRRWTVGEFGAGLFVHTLAGALTDAPAPFNDPALTVTSFAISPDEGLALVGSASGFVCLFDTATGEELWGQRAHRGHVTAAAFSPDGRRAYSGSAAGALSVHPWPLE